MEQRPTGEFMIGIDPFSYDWFFIKISLIQAMIEKYL